MKLSGEKRKQMLKLIKEGCINNKDRFQIMSEVNLIFKSDYKVCSFKHLKLEAYQEERLEKLRKDSEYMKRCNAIEPNKGIDYREEYAEQLFQLFYNGGDGDDLLILPEEIEI